MINRRPAFINRPWITGKLYDSLSRSSILHLDAHVFYLPVLNVTILVLDWRTGGRNTLAYDQYTVEASGLTPARGLDVSGGIPQAWGAHNPLGIPWAALHARVTDLADTAADAGEARGQWSRVSLLAHYVPRPSTDVEISANAYKEYITCVK